MADRNDVYLGVWTNYSYSAVLGSTITLTQSNAALLIAFVAFFVAIVSTRFWRLACFILHTFVYSAEAPQDGLYHQRQVLLRNIHSAEAGFNTLVLMMWAWRRSHHVWRRLLPLLALSMLCFAGWAVTTVFSSRISTGGEVLLLGSKCATLAESSTNTTISWGSITPEYSRIYQSAATYVKQCYLANSSSSALGCGGYVQRSLPSTIKTTNTGCPFDPRICRSQQNNIILDTGYLDSHDHFGVNAPPDQRIQFRRVLQCAPLMTDGYTTNYNVSSDRSYTRYFYGAPFNNFGTEGNHTAVFSNDDLYDIKVAAGTTGTEYKIIAHQAIMFNGTVNWDESSFSPIPELERPDGDLFLIFLVNSGVLYAFQNEDGLFYATKEVGHITTGFGDPSENGTTPVYMPTLPAAALGCIQQQQFCNPNLPEGQRCTPLAGFDESLIAVKAMFSSDADSWVRFHWMAAVAQRFDTTVADIVAFLGAGALRARDTLSVGIQGQLPDNQWQLEVQFWHYVCLATFQAYFTLAPNRLDNPKLEELSYTPNSTVENALCNNQKIISSSYISFSVFGLAFTLAVGSLIIILSFVLPHAVHCCVLPCSSRRRHQGAKYVQLEWGVNETFQLQRMAHEAVGMGTWSGVTDSIPVTKPRQNLAMLDLTDLKHPRLAALTGGDSENTGVVKVEPSRQGSDSPERSPAKNAMADTTTVERTSSTLSSANNDVVPTVSLAEDGSTMAPSQIDHEDILVLEHASAGQSAAGPEDAQNSSENARQERMAMSTASFTD